MFSVKTIRFISKYSSPAPVCLESADKNISFTRQAVLMYYSSSLSFLQCAQIVTQPFIARMDCDSDRFILPW